MRNRPSYTARPAGPRVSLLVGKEGVPGITRVAAIGNQAHPGVQTELKESEAAAQRLGLTLQYFPVYSVRDFDVAFEAIARDGAQALIAFPDTLINHQAKPIAEFAARRRIPAVSGWAEFAHAGNLMSYGPNLLDFHRHTAVYVDKLLKGARPADLPVEQPTRFELVINLKAAKTLGLNIPQSLLVQANEIIK